MQDRTRTRVAKAGARARHDPRTYARSIVARWPELDPAVREEIRGMLAPVVARVVGNGANRGHVQAVRAAQGGDGR